jgi:hypothetical protein
MLSRARLRFILKQTMIWSASWSAVTCLGLFGVQHLVGNSMQDAKALFKDAQMQSSFDYGYDNGQPGFERTPGLEASYLSGTSPSSNQIFHVHAATPTAARHWLEHHVGSRNDGYAFWDGTYFVTQSSPQHLTLVGRSGRGPIVEVSGTLQKLTEAKTLDAELLNPWFLLRLIGEESGALFLFCLLGEFLTERSQSRRLREWRRLVPGDIAWGPADPEDNFNLLTAVVREHGSEPWLQTVSMSWSQGRWQEQEKGEHQRTFKNPDGGETEKAWRAGAWQDAEALPAALTAQRVPAEEDAQEVSARWFDYVRAVAEWNASRWQIRLKREEQLREAEQLRELTQGQSLGDLLPEAHELLRGLPVES